MMNQESKMGSVLRLLLHLVALSVFSYADPNFKNVFKQVTKEVQNEALTDITGNIPKWLTGDFVRQMCASYGEVDGDLSGSISHMFDCIPMVGRYKFENGEVQYSNQFFDSRSTRIWKHYGMNISRSKVSWPTVMADIDIPAFIKDIRTPFNETLFFIPSINFWRSGSQDPIFAITESFNSPTALRTSPDLEIIGMHFRRFNDEGFPPSFRVPNQHPIVNTPAHEQTDPDGTIWSSTLEVERFSNTKIDNLEIAMVVYNIKGNNRTLASRHVLGKYNLSSCSSLKQADLDIMPGYSHFIQTTSNHILVPQTSYRFDYCLDFNNSRRIMPFFRGSFEWHPTVNSSILVFERADMTKVHHVYLPYAKFFSHDVNAYEDETHIYLDVMAYNNSDLYLEVTKPKSMINELPWNTSIIRIAIDKRSWTYDETKSGSLTETNPFGQAEFPNINYERNHQRNYNFTYFVGNSLYRGAKIGKLNVVTKKTMFWTPPLGYYPQEPIFVQSEGGNDEDGGIVLCSGPVSNPPGTSFLAILNAKDLTQMALVRNPNAAPFGLHNRFYKRKPKMSSSSSTLSLLSILLLFPTIQLAFI